MSNTNTPAAVTCTTRDDGATFRTSAYGPAAKAALVRAAHDFVFASGRSAEVGDTYLAGRFGGAYVDATCLDVRFV